MWSACVGGHAMKLLEMGVARVNAVPMRDSCSSIATFMSRRTSMARSSSTWRVIRCWNFAGNSLAAAVASSAGRVLSEYIIYRGVVVLDCTRQAYNLGNGGVPVSQFTMTLWTTLARTLLQFHWCQEVERGSCPEIAVDGIGANHEK
jgi:hypothetical protein